MISEINGHKLEDLFEVVADGNAQSLSTKMRDARVIGQMRDVITQWTSLSPKDAVSAAGVLIALGPEGRAQLLTHVTGAAARDFLLAGHYPAHPALALPAVIASPAAVPAAHAHPVPPPQPPLPHPRPPSADPPPNAPLSPSDDDEVISCTTTSRPVIDPASARVLLRHLADALGSTAAAQHASVTPPAKIAISAALIKDAMVSLSPLSEDDRDGLDRRGIPRATQETYDEVVVLVASGGADGAVEAGLVSAGASGSLQTGAALGALVMRRLATLGRDEAAGAVRHMPHAHAAYTAATAEAQGRFETWAGTASLPDIDVLVAPFAWPTATAIGLPTQDYYHGWAQWGLCAALGLSPHPRARGLRAQLRVALTPQWEAAVATAAKLHGTRPTSYAPPPPSRPRMTRTVGSKAPRTLADTDEAPHATHAKCGCGTRLRRGATACERCSPKSLCTAAGCTKRVETQGHRLCLSCWNQKKVATAAGGGSKPTA